MTKLLQYHMTVNKESVYLKWHAIISGKIAQDQFSTYEDYKRECQEYGIEYYNEEVFNSHKNRHTIKQ